MPPLSAKPVLFLAFANDRLQRAGYLRNLGHEADQLRTVLQPANAICEVIERHSVTPDQILQLFQQQKDRIALFHYAGHADEYTLLLEDQTGGHVMADGRGLAAFLQQQRGLRLVFLNACSTRAQAQSLLAAGVAAVIATARKIDDKVATAFATNFYRALASGDTLQAAFDSAQAAMQLGYGDQLRHLSIVEEDEEEHQQQSWPWQLYTAEGDKAALTWSLHQAANDPFFGLPPLPKLDLPAKPFRDLSWFRHADAPIFFGRGWQIRELYTILTDPNSAPILLFYGQSGVGKSSLLEAGLLPRLEQVQAVVYMRRDPEEGLLGTLLQNLPKGNHSADKLLTDWCNYEQATQQPLTLLLDQVEEYFTRTNQPIANEMAGFVDALVTLFAQPEARPQGKLILSFRKEWLAEIEKRLTERDLPTTKLFLERLDRPRVIEAVTGVSRTPALQQKYKLTIKDEELPEEIANELLTDRDAPIAPMLQILLTRLWEEAGKRSQSAPCFDRPLYDQLRREGLKLDQFLDRQLTELGKQHPDVVVSGLALDLLAFHTTPLGTAEQRDFATLQKEYQHRQAILPELVRGFQNLYLLAIEAVNIVSPPVSSSLTTLHDLLGRIGGLGLGGHESTVTSAAFSLDGKTLASGSNDTTIRLWHQSESLLLLACRLAGRFKRCSR